jgi:hypothetical protein
MLDRTGIISKPPNWHFTFDGHLHDPVKRFGGLTDKSDEKGRPRMKVIARKETFCCIRNFFKKRQKCIMRAWWWQQYHSFLPTIEEFESRSTKHISNMEQKRSLEEKKAEIIESKKVKGETFIHMDN